jgi:hypothetical protein
VEKVKADFLLAAIERADRLCSHAEMLRRIFEVSITRTTHGEAVHTLLRLSMTKTEARQIVFNNLRSSGCPERIARRVFEVSDDFISTAENIVRSRRDAQVRRLGGEFGIVAESRATGKCFEQLLEEKSPNGYRTLIKRQAADNHKRYLDVIAKQPVGPYIDNIHRHLALSIAEQIALDAEFERKWDAIRTNLRCAGAHS